MVAEAAQIGQSITRADDSRATKVGRLLRRTKLDELAQLVNVLKGDVSLVGPRPEDPRYVALYTFEQRAILQHRLGITSLASLKSRRNEQLLIDENWEHVYVHEIMPSKLALDLEYAQFSTIVSEYLK